MRLAVLLAAFAAMPASAQTVEGPPPAAPAVPFEAPRAAALALPPAAFTLDHPQVIDTGRLAGDGKVVPLFGITGESAPAPGLLAFIQGHGDQVACQPRGAGSFTCLLPDHTDVALVSLANGAARAAADAPDAYTAQEAEAQAARRGIWAGLPPPPVMVSHPVARTSAVLVSEQVVYRMHGLEGVAGAPASSLQAYIAAHGDSLQCQPQADAKQYLCTLPDGTDIAVVALAKGFARAARDAPDAYRLVQAQAMEQRRGVWAARAQPFAAPAPPAAMPVVVPDPGPPPGDVTPAYAPPAYAPPAYAPPAYAPPAYAVTPEAAAGGVGYAGDQPTAIIGGETVFLIYGAGLGWGYYDHFRHWRGAPERVAHDLDRFHPERRGPRGYDGPAPGSAAPGIAAPGFVAAGGGREGPPGVRFGPPGFARRPSFREEPGGRAERLAFRAAPPTVAAGSPVVQAEPPGLRGIPPQYPHGGLPAIVAPTPVARPPVFAGAPGAGTPFAQRPAVAPLPPVARLPVFAGVPPFAHPAPMLGFGRPVMPQIAAPARPPMPMPAQPASAGVFGMRR